MSPTLLAAINETYEIMGRISLWRLSRACSGSDFIKLTAKVRRLKMPLAGCGKTGFLVNFPLRCDLFIGRERDYGVPQSPVTEVSNCRRGRWALFSGGFMRLRAEVCASSPSYRPPVRSRISNRPARPHDGESYADRPRS